MKCPWWKQLSVAVIAAGMTCMPFTPRVMALEDAIVAIVNDQIITFRDLKEYLDSIYHQLRVEGKPQEEILSVMDEYQTKGINKLIEDKLILSRANEVGIEVRGKLVNERIQDIRSKYENEQIFLENLKAEGMTITDLRKKITDQLKGQFIVNHEVKSQIFVNPHEVTEYYETHINDFRSIPKVYLESIFVSHAKGVEAGRARAEEARQAILSGQRFEDVAKTYSEAPSVGVIEKGQMKEEIETAVFQMRIGEVSPVLDVENGSYVFLVTGKQAGSTLTLQEVKEQIYNKIFGQKFRVAFDKWIKDLRDTAYVEIKN